MNILIVEDEPLIAEDLASCLIRNNFDITGIAYSYQQALHELKLHLPDLVLLDINLNNDLEGIRIANYINENFQIPFIFITSYSDKATLDLAKVTLPAGYIVKPFNEASIYTAIEVSYYNHTQKNTQNYPELSIVKLNQSISNQISIREFELLKLIYEGNTNKQISEKLFISANTVKKHINHIYLKLDTVSRSYTLVKLRQIMNQ